MRSLQILDDFVHWELSNVVTHHNMLDITTPGNIDTLL